MSTEILEGSLVTVELEDQQSGSNVYSVLRKLPDSCVLFHPIAPECLIIRPDAELNKVFPTEMSPIERCFSFARKNRQYLSYSMAADLDALCYYYVIKKKLTSKQRAELANICGKIASVILSNNVAAAVNEIKYNKALLDEYNHILCNSIKGILNDPLSLEGKGQRFTLFNIAGFVLAQTRS